MKVVIIGTGYVGLSLGLSLAEKGHTVLCIDKEKEKIEKLSNGVVKIYEEKMEELLQRNLKNKKINFENELTHKINDFDILFLCVGTPSKADGSAELSFLFEASKEISKVIDRDIPIVIKSTVPVGTSKIIKNIIEKNSKTNININIISNPEFLQEGKSLYNCLNPDRIIVGISNLKSKNIMLKLYESFLENKEDMIFMSNESAEMTKYVANCFLATKISFINEMANICELVNANIADVKRGIIKDKRIGEYFLNPGCGYGGSCFPKDVKSLIRQGKEYGYEASILKSVHEVNENQKYIIVNKIKNNYKELKHCTFCIWGLSFKPNTNDIREAPSLTIIKELLENGANINVYDPKVKRSDFNIQDFDINKVNFFDDKYEALNNSNALIILTEWDEFKNIDYDIVKEKLSDLQIYDGRNIFDRKQMKDSGIKYNSIGGI